MEILSKKIILDELIENNHLVPVEDVIFWALENYCKEKKNTQGSAVAYSIIERIKECEDKESSNFNNTELVNTVFGS